MLDGVPLPSGTTTDQSIEQPSVVDIVTRFTTITELRLVLIEEPVEK